MKSFLIIGMEGTSAAAVLATAREFGWCEGEPSYMFLKTGGDDLEVPRDWLKHLERASSTAGVAWGHPPNHAQVEVSASNMVVGLQIPDFTWTMENFERVADTFAYDWLTCFEMFPDGWDEKEDFHKFPGIHPTHGPFVAFRGDGHRRLVSRRWLDFGPWRVIRRPGDLSLVQFHDLEVDEHVAYEQAWPGHQHMGYSSIGGFLPNRIELPDVRGLYDAERETLEVVVPPGGVVEPRAMLEACWVRRRHGIFADLEQPIEQVAYVFVDEQDARAHLHELWLHELECWLADDRGKRRLDLDYHPTPVKPAWVRDLEQRDPR